jgi:hypothetical protein
LCLEYAKSIVILNLSEDEEPNLSLILFFLGGWGTVSAIKPYEGFGDVDHTIKELMSF